MSTTLRHVGLAAAFRDEAAFTAAVEGAIREERWEVQTYTPRPVAGVERLLVPKRSRLPRIVFAAFVLGAGAGFLLQVYPSVFSYPHNVGGRPFFSWPAFVPVAFELGVLTAACTGFVAFLWQQRWPRLFLRELNCSLVRQASEDRFVVVLRPHGRSCPGEELAAMEERLRARGAEETERCPW